MGGGRLSNPRSTGKAGGNWGREAEGWKKEIREEEGEGKEEEINERHVHQCLDAHSDTPTTTPDTCRGKDTGSESDRADARLSARPSEEGREGRNWGPERGMSGTGEENGKGDGGELGGQGRFGDTKDPNEKTKSDH